ncbi:MAG: hypothetical protein LBE57_05315, partial [Methanosarcinales archaeon]|nr:hypothetical protein [Methanosarcinales archaeon]
MLNLVEKYGKSTTIKFTNNYSLLKRHIFSLVEDLNHEIIISKQEEQVLIVEKNATAAAVADILDDDTATKTIRYNHFLLKGDLNAKRDILFS